VFPHLNSADGFTIGTTGAARESDAPGAGVEARPCPGVSGAVPAPVTVVRGEREERAASAAAGKGKKDNEDMHK
jgi:hypothetical protein